MQEEGSMTSRATYLSYEYQEFYPEEGLSSNNYEMSWSCPPFIDIDLQIPRRKYKSCSKSKFPCPLPDPLPEALPILSRK